MQMQRAARTRSQRVFARVWPVRGRQDHQSCTRRACTVPRPKAAEAGGAWQMRAEAGGRQVQADSRGLGILLQAAGGSLQLN